MKARAKLCPACYIRIVLNFEKIFLMSIQEFCAKLQATVT